MMKTVLFVPEPHAKEGFVTADQALRKQHAATPGDFCSRGHPRHGPTFKNCKSRESP
jgi:hypothetical protein